MLLILHWSRVIIVQAQGSVCANAGEGSKHMQHIYPCSILRKCCVHALLHTLIKPSVVTNLQLQQCCSSSLVRGFDPAYPGICKPHAHTRKPSPSARRKNSQTFTTPKIHHRQRLRAASMASRLLSDEQSQATCETTGFQALSHPQPLKPKLNPPMPEAY